MFLELIDQCEGRGQNEGPHVHHQEFGRGVNAQNLLKEPKIRTKKLIIFPSSLPFGPFWSLLPHRNHSPSNHRGAATQPDAAMYALQGRGGRGEQGGGEGLQSDPLSWEDFTLLFQTERERTSATRTAGTAKKKKPQTQE